MDEKRADLTVFKDRDFLFALMLVCVVLIGIGVVIYYVQT
jgi:hypothetical protein